VTFSLNCVKVGDTGTLVVTVAVLPPTLTLKDPGLQKHPFVYPKLNRYDPAWVILTVWVFVTGPPPKPNPASQYALFPGSANPRVYRLLKAALGNTQEPVVVQFVAVQDMPSDKFRPGRLRKFPLLTRFCAVAAVGATMIAVIESKNADRRNRPSPNGRDARLLQGASLTAARANRELSTTALTRSPELYLDIIPTD
jgi:hypothetical protein